MFKAFSSNQNTECTYYPEAGKYAVINNSDEPQKTVLFSITGKKTEVLLNPKQFMVCDEREVW